MTQELKEVKKYPNYTFSWVDVATPDPEAGKRFYCDLFGWTFEDNPVPGGVYTMLSLHGKTVAGLSGMPPGQDDLPGYWTSYVTTYDIEADAARVVEAGGTLLAPPFDVEQAGRMALLIDSAGAMSAMWEPKEHIGAALVNQNNTLVWNELVTKETKMAAAFYKALYGWESHFDPAQNYTAFSNNGRVMAGMLEITEEMGETPPHWMVYFMVEDVDAMVAKAADLGGSAVIPPFDTGVGRIGLVADPQGVTFSLITFNGDVDDPPQG